MDSAIFKAYDVRGLYPEQIDASAARAIGRALARYLDGGPIVVGRDMRESGILLQQALTEGLRSEGASVIDIGRVATPMLYFATSRFQAQGGAMITASHNPGAYNGLKVCARDAVPVGLDSGLREVRDLALGLLDQPLPESEAELRTEDVRLAYVDSLLELFPRCPDLDVVIDAGNGIAGEALESLLARLPLRVTPMYFEPDGSFPNHEADPLKPENVVDLQREVRARGAALGVAFDGDGDRAFFIDERGDRVPADLMTALLARTVIEAGLLGAAPGCSILYDLRSSWIVKQTVEALGCTPVRSRVGHAFMKQRMRESGSRFGGELSGHYYFPFPAGYVADDGAAAFLLVLQALAISGRPLSELWRPLAKYAQSGEVNTRVSDVQKTLEAVRSAYSQGQADELDGLTVAFDDWWFNLRPSNTEPLLRLNVEAPDQGSMEAHRDAILKLLGEFRSEG